jgi:hypothetical protein
MKDQKIALHLTTPRRHKQSSKAWQGTIAKTASTDEQIIEQTPTLKRLYDFLRKGGKP